MTFQGNLYTAISTDAGLTTLVGTRIYPNVAPPDPTLPFIVYYEFATPREHGFDNVVAVHKPRIQYSVYANLYSEALDVIDALRAALSATSFPVIFEDERGNQDVTSGLYRRDLDVRIPHV